MTEKSWVLLAVRLLGDDERKVGWHIFVTQMYLHWNPQHCFCLFIYILVTFLFFGEFLAVQPSEDVWHNLRTDTHTLRGTGAIGSNVTA